jgi:hypothetical protein
MIEAHAARPDLASRTWVVVARGCVGVVTLVVWAAAVVLTAMVGSCDAFGGTCDGAKRPLLDDDVVNGTFLVTAVAAWLLWWLVRPSKRSLVTGLPVALAAGVFVALVVRSMTA